MADAIVARILGDDHQALWFWYKASDIFQKDSIIQTVTWEAVDVPGFDDIVVKYHRPIIDKTHEISADHYQIKFHVDHRNKMTCASLTDPAFIGNTEKSILQKLHDCYKKDPVKFSQSRYYFQNTWQVDYTDPLHLLIDNESAIILKRLYEGKTDKSKFGQVRKLWKDHLEIKDDEEFKAVIRGLRIKTIDSSHEQTVDHLNQRLVNAGLRKIDLSARENPYIGLIKRLHADGITVFEREGLEEILRKEDLFDNTGALEDDELTIGIRSFKRGTESIRHTTKRYLCLLQYFAGRFVHEEVFWESQILPAIEKFADELVELGVPLNIHLDTHLSIAYALGFYLDPKFGVQAVVVQKTQFGKVLFDPKPAEGTQSHMVGESFWQSSSEVLSATGKDIAVIINITWEIETKVKEYLNTGPTDIGQILSFTIAGGAGRDSIKDGNHLYQAIRELVKTVHGIKSGISPDAKTHLFIAAPNAFAFFYGQQSRILGTTVLYEFDMENKVSGSYHPALILTTK